MEEVAAEGSDGINLWEITRYTAAYDRKKAAGQAMAKLVAAGR